MEWDQPEGSSKRQSKSEAISVQVLASAIEIMQGEQKKQNEQQKALQTQLQAILTGLEALRGGNATPSQDGLLDPKSPAVLTPAASNAPSPQPTQGTAPGAVIKRKPLPNPSEFKGDRSKFPDWETEMVMKLNADHEFIGAPRDQFYFIYQCLGGAARNTMAPYFREGGPNKDYNPQDFMQHLKDHYTDPNAVARATQELFSIRQGTNESFASFISRFERQIAEAQATTWPDSAKLGSLLQAITPRLRAVLATSRLPTDNFRNWAAEAAVVAGIMERLPTSAGGLGLADKHTWGGARARGTTTDTDGDTKMTGIQASGTQAGRKRAVWVSEDVRDHRRRNNECIRCGKPGHHIARCRLGPAIPPKRQGNTNIKTASFRKAPKESEGEEDEEDDEPGAGNE